MEIIDYKSHKCKKSEGKIILVEIDKLGNTKCGYCHNIVNYKLKSKSNSNGRKDDK